MQAPGAGFYTVTVTGVVGGMLPPKPGDLLMNTSPVYAQIFINHNGECWIAFFVLIDIELVFRVLLHNVDAHNVNVTGCVSYLT
jgi:hypothetical protein